MYYTEINIRNKLNNLRKGGRFHQKHKILNSKLNQL